MCKCQSVVTLSAGDPQPRGKGSLTAQQLSTLGKTETGGFHDRLHLVGKANKVRL